MKNIFSSIRLNKIQYAVKRVTKGSVHHYTPVVKLAGWFPSWTPIVKLYPEQYILLPYEVEGLTMIECKQHIEQYKIQSKLEEEENLSLIQYLNV